MILRMASTKPKKRVGRDDRSTKMIGNESYPAWKRRDVQELWAVGVEGGCEGSETVLS